LKAEQFGTQALSALADFSYLDLDQLLVRPY
jgi:hypothetical protein